MNILKYKNILFGLSGALAVAGLIAMFVWGFRPGIEFAGGSILEIEIANVQDPNASIEQAYKAAVNETPLIQKLEGIRYSVRTKTLTNEEKNAVLSNIRDVQHGAVTELRFESISPSISSDILRRAILGVIAAAIAILFYISYSFRRVPKPMSSWRFGAAAVVALLHDTVILLGAYAIISHYFGAEVDSLFITAVLTLLGFSVHDTIVTFDRIRENLLRHSSDDLEQLMNNSIVETIVRSINTSFVLLLVLLAMLFFGGNTLRFFTLALTIGVLAGTYSSIFVATPLLLLWQKKAWDNYK